MEEGDVSVSHVVEGDPAVDPLRVVLRETSFDVGHDLGRNPFPRYEVDALKVCVRNDG